MMLQEDDHAEQRLGILTDLFNVTTDPAAQYSVLLKTVKLAQATSKALLLSPTLRVRPSSSWWDKTHLYLSVFVLNRSLGGYWACCFETIDVQDRITKNWTISLCQGIPDKTAKRPEYDVKITVVCDGTITQLLRVAKQRKYRADNVVASVEVCTKVYYLNEWWAQLN